MRLRHQKQHYTTPQLDITAMIDVVFLLLIFFMCTASFKPIEDELPSHLPALQPPQKSQLEEFGPVRINLTSLPQSVQITCDQTLCDDFDQLLDLLQKRRALADLPVIITGQSNVEYHYMVTALDTCYQADLHKVIFSTQNPKP